ncbi:unnamed protein product [Prorocentrum cordatum]|uniref:Uncharacterized protein n=1 Tax=Prorocentrum cordatum TaxID=2364126 RepID=A0ABN9V869_9DINO|nr:unnamed protein product [Polarella glacialis]
MEAQFISQSSVVINCALRLGQILHEVRKNIGDAMKRLAMGCISSRLNIALRRKMSTAFNMLMMVMPRSLVQRGTASATRHGATAPGVVAVQPGVFYSSMLNFREPTTTKTAAVLIIKSTRLSTTSDTVIIFAGRSSPRCRRRHPEGHLRKAVGVLVPTVHYNVGLDRTAKHRKMMTQLHLQYVTSGAVLRRAEHEFILLLVCSNSGAKNDVDLAPVLQLPSEPIQPREHRHGRSRRERGGGLT